MIHPISAETCTQAWTQAITLLGKEKQHCAYNVILDIENPYLISENFVTQFKHPGP